MILTLTENIEAKIAVKSFECSTKLKNLQNTGKMSKHFFLGSRFQSSQGKFSLQDWFLLAEESTDWLGGLLRAELPACSITQGITLIFCFLFSRCWDVLFLKQLRKGLLPLWLKFLVAEDSSSRQSENIMQKWRLKLWTFKFKKVFPAIDRYLKVRTCGYRTQLSIW